MGKFAELKELTGESDTLVVLLHAWRNRPSDLCEVREVVDEVLKGPDVFMPRLPLSTRSNSNPVTIACDLLADLDEANANRERKCDKGYKEIILIGHSVGALLARKLYVYARGEHADAPFEAEFTGNRAGCRWSDSVTRIILLAGMNRGWTVSPEVSPLKAALFRVAIFLSKVTFTAGLIHSVRRGAPFITELRIQWLAMKRFAKDEKARLPKDEKTRLALTIQLLGTIDDIVTPDDNVDLQSGEDFVYIDVPHTRHADIIRLSEDPTGTRERIVKKALEETRERLGDENEFHPSVEQAEDASIRHVVFVIHGIRDYGFWTSRIARRIERLAREPGQQSPCVATICHSYGYFPMLPFLFSFERQKHVRWLMDEYVWALARYPKADRFSYVGHSNGTYLLASALRQYRGCHFDAVVFAGSVVSTKFEWKTYLAEGRGHSPRVRRVLNLVASMDAVVGIFPGFFEQLGSDDLGKGGYKGFEDLDDGGQQLKYVIGGHGAAIEEDKWEGIAQFVVNGSANAFPQDEIAIDRRPEWRSRFVALLSAGAVVPWLIIAAIVTAPLWLGLGARACWCLSDSQWALFAICWWFVIYKIGTKA